MDRKHAGSGKHAICFVGKVERTSNLAVACRKPAGMCWTERPARCNLIVYEILAGDRA